MKKIILMATLLLSIALVNRAFTQVHVNLNVNLNSQPGWGPVGYDHVEYYYMPDIDAFYYVPNRQYIYMDGGRWIFASSLPPRFHYDIYNGYKVVINDPTPYRHVETYRTQYIRYKGNHRQEMIRDSHDPRYFGNRDHPEHGNWKKERDDNREHGNNGRGHGNHGRGNGHGND